MTVNLHKGPLPTERKAKLCQYILRAGDFKLSAAEMFSFDPNPTRTKNLLLVLLLVYFMVVNDDTYIVEWLKRPSLSDCQ